MIEKAHSDSWVTIICCVYFDSRGSQLILALSRHIQSIENLEDKRNKLSASNPKVKTHNGQKMPVDSELGEVIEYFLKVIGPAQQRVLLSPCNYDPKIELC